MAGARSSRLDDVDHVMPGPLEVVQVAARLDGRPDLPERVPVRLVDLVSDPLTHAERQADLRPGEPVA